MGYYEYKPTPRVIISQALFTLNFFNLEEQGKSVAERHLTISKYHNLYIIKMMMGTGSLASLANEGRGHTCAFTDKGGVIWIPSRLVKPRHE